MTTRRLDPLLEERDDEAQELRADPLLAGAFARAVINGTGRADTLRGTGAADRIDGRGGNDRIDGRGGGDTLIGGPGGDTLIGGGGKDTLIGGGGGDTLNGGGGNDTLRGGGGDNTLSGGGGDDTLEGGKGKDSLDGGTGKDSLDGGAGNDTLVGGAQNDSITGGGGRDSLEGGGGKDTLSGNGGPDTLQGGGGNDTLSGGGGDDNLDGGGGRDTLRGGGGNDVYFVDAANEVDTTVSDPGTDTVQSEVSFTLGAQQERLTLLGSRALSGTGNAGSNIITGNTGANVLSGGAGNDTLRGGSGNDTLRGDAGTDRLEGGNGNDTYVIDGAGEIPKSVADPGTDTVQSAVGYTLGAHQEHLTLTGSAGLSGTGNTGANTLTGNAGDNTLDGGAGADRLNGAGGDDRLVFDPDDLSVLGGTGNDTLLPDGAGAAVDLGEVPTIADVETVDLTGNGNNAFSVAAEDLDAIAGAGGLLTVLGEAGDTATATGGFTLRADVVDGSNTFTRYEFAGDTLRLETTLTHDVVLAAIGLEALDGADGVVFEGVAAGDISGIDVGPAGDVNGDGFDDLLIGASEASSQAGAVYVLFGGETGFATDLTLDTLDGADGFRLDGAAGDYAGYSVGGGIDLNGDGYDDLIVGAQGNGAAGAAYVVFGGTAGFGSSVALSGLDGADGFRLDGAASGDLTGRAVSGAGDVNGDGFDDLIVGADSAQPGLNAKAGASYVLFGTGTAAGASTALASLDGSNGFRIAGKDANQYSGRTVAAAGDVNGDGLADVVVGAPSNPGGGGGQGEAHVVFGRTGGFASSLAIAGLDGADGFRLLGGTNGDLTGFSVSGAGDVNGDGFGDVVVGARGVDSSAGAAYVVFGASGGFSGTVDLTALDGVDGFRLDGIDANDRTGTAVSAAGDWNGDGYDDLLVGASGGAGEAYVLFGRSAPFAATLEASELDGSDGLAFLGVDAGDNLGISVAGVDDVNGDGFDDLLLGAFFAAAAAGESYVVLGYDALNVVDPSGTAGADVLVSGADESTLDGLGGADVLRGAAGDDVLVYDPVDRIADGGSGTDTLRLDGSGVTLDLASTGSLRLEDLEVIGLENGGNTLSLDVRSLLALSSSGNTLRVTGGGADTVSATGTGWVDGGSVDIDAVTYRVFTSGAATLQVQSGITLEVPASISLASLDGSDGFRLDGIDAADQSGTSVSGAGDVNGDGFADLIVGAFQGAGNSLTTSGESYVVFGGSAAFGSAIDLSTLDGADGFRLDGAAAYDNSGRAVSGAGDVNGDGFDDLLIGAPEAGSYAGEAYVVFGKSTFGADVDLLGLDGTVGYRAEGVSPSDRLGAALSGAGDVNADGYADIVVGAPQGDPAGGANAGESYVVFGKASGFVSALDLGALDGADGVRLDGVSASDAAGTAVSGAGDVNGDGVDDLLVGAQMAGASTGHAYVVYGVLSAFAGDALGLSALDGADGFRIEGISAGDDTAASVAAAGDVNGDGYADLVIGAPGSDSDVGAAYLLFGSSSGVGSNLELSTLGAAIGVRINGIDTGDTAGVAVAGVGDLNGDGLDDVLIGAKSASSGGEANAGESYVLFGRSGGFGSSLDLDTLGADQGFVLRGVDASDASGSSVAGAGDLNGDGFDDLLVGAPGAAPGGDAGAGETYVVLGRDFAGTVDFAGTGAADDHDGTAAAEILHGGLGADDLDGAGGADVLLGGAGDDRLGFDPADARVDGGAGSDTLYVLGTDQAVDLTALDEGRFEGIEVLDGTGGGGNDFTLHYFDLLDITGAENTLRILGESADSVTVSGGTWNDDGAGVVTGFHQYTQNGLTLLVDTDITSVTFV